ncbi:hypothetical protein AGMMS50218_16660 [Actinomycetota bacterium]|nr:hypothetical protein AGMMS50218_16660 [Actinomycetota bacterium]
MLADDLDLLTGARSHLAALCAGVPGGVDYEELLCDLDDLYPQVPATPVLPPAGPARQDWYTGARRAITALGADTDAGVALALAVLVARLDETWEHEHAHAHTPVGRS